MQYVCDATNRRTWFRIETEAEAEAESELMRHAVAKHFKRMLAATRRGYVPGPGLERDIGLKAYLKRMSPMFLTLRADDGEALATAMLPPEKSGGGFDIIIVGPENADPWPSYGGDIDALARHFDLSLPRERCYPYARS